MTYLPEALNLLSALIKVPSYSKSENGTADLLQAYFNSNHIPTQRIHNNVLAKSKFWEEQKPTLLLNSHHDTVKPVAGWVRDPFLPTTENDQLFGLGSNDAGASLVSLIQTFRHFYGHEKLPYNLLFIASAEEEISGPNGVGALADFLEGVTLGIVGEPTNMQLAVAEKGLLVIDAKAKGISGHAAREEGVNAIEIAMRDIQKIQNLRFEKSSKFLGPNKLTVTQIQAGQQHNVIPDSCQFVIDIRTNEFYSNQKMFAFLQSQLISQLTARSFRLNASNIDPNHPLVKAGESLGLKPYGSPTLSDQAQLKFPCLKIGPGDSGRSHTADEFIRPSEVEQGIHLYIELLNRFFEVESVQ